MISSKNKGGFLDTTKASACIHCGLCLSSCPTFLETGNENDSPRGRIYLMRALDSGRMRWNDAAVRHLDLCLGCRACEVACPSGVQYGSLLESTRNALEQRHRRKPFDFLLRRVLVEQIFPHPDRMRLATAPARLAKKMRLDALLPGRMGEMLRLLPAVTNDRPVPEYSVAQGEKRGTVGLIRGCVMSALFSRLHEATLSLLTKAGYDVIAPDEQVCCGALFAHSGRLDKARENARKNIRVFREFSLDAVIINAAGCGSTLKEYGHLLGEENAAKEFAGKVRDLSEFLVGAGFVGKLASRESKLVTFHDACHLAHAQRITQPPRLLVKKVAGSNFVELPEADVCCGSAGSYNVTEPRMAAQLQDRKIRNIIKSGAEIVVTTNPGCLLQMQAGLTKLKGSPVEIVHLAEFLDRHS